MYAAYNLCNIYYNYYIINLAVSGHTLWKRGIEREFYIITSIILHIYILSNAHVIGATLDSSYKIDI